MVRNIPVLLRCYLELCAVIPHFIATRMLIMRTMQPNREIKNGYIVTDFIMILLLSSIYEDDNGIESPDIAKIQNNSSISVLHLVMQSACYLR